MHLSTLFRALLAALAILAVVGSGAVRAQNASPHAIQIPGWFAPSFLDFREDVDDARRQGKRVMLYIGQDGCPYCARLMQVNFKQPDIVAYTREHFIAIELNMWGDRETVWLDGVARAEKDLAKALDVQFTPTLLFLNEEGDIIARINGYYEPARFMAALRYAGEHLESKIGFAEHLQQATAKPKAKMKSGFVDQPFFIKPPYDLRRKPEGKPLAVLVEAPSCETCAELHEKGFPNPQVREQIDKLDIARFALDERSPITTPDGRSTTAADWLATQRITYTPSVLFFDQYGKAVFRLEAYVGPFHLASAFDYISSGAYLKEPSFQRYLQRRADELRAQGRAVIMD